jgi:hypothetical protein
MAEGAINVVERRLAEATAGDAWWTEACARAEREGATALPELYPALARRLGRALIGGGRVTEPSLAEGGRPAVVDLDAWRVCDAGGFRLIALCPEITAEQIVDLFLHGDFEERAIVMRAQALRPADTATTALFGEAQRTNTATHFEALCCESNLAARACGADGFGLDDLNRLVVKAAFLDVPLARLFEAEDHANGELSRMLQDFATEREAAGRPVWADTDRLLGLAPTRGTILRLVGALEHGSDRRRHLAAEALARMDLPDLAALISDRAAREPVAETRTLLESLSQKWSG